MFPAKKTQLNYVIKITELMLLYSYRNKNKIDFKNLINNYCDIYRKTNLYNKNKSCFKTNKEKVWKKIIDDIHRYSFFNKQKYLNLSLKKLKPFFVKRVEEKINLTEYNLSAKYGCFNYSIIEKKIDLHMPVFQFINHKNFKKNYSYDEKFKMRAKDLLKLLKNVKKKYPKIKKIQMGSWLNEYKPFRSLFPKTWKPTKKEKKKNSIAWWGQFVRSDGNINEDLYKKFKKNLKFKYKGKFYECNVNQLYNYLKAIEHG